MNARYYKRRRALPIYDGEALTEPVDYLEDLLDLRCNERKRPAKRAA